jgi:tight adherence protein B
MLTGLLLAAALMGILPLPWGIAIAMIWTEPLVAAPAVLAAASKARRHRDRRSRHDLIARWLITLAAELRAGRTLRSSLIGAVEAVPELELGLAARSSSAGRPLEEAAEIIASHDGLAPAAVALRVAARTGGSVVGVFDALTTEAVDEGSLERERRTLTAQARLSVALVGGFPLAVLGFQIVSGDAGRLLAQGPVGTSIVIVGGALLVAGLGAVWLLLRRARQAR